jgi:hypothetical protein
MHISNYLGFTGVALGVVGSVYSLSVVVRQFLAERKLTTMMAKDDEFRRIVERQARESAAAVSGQQIPPARNEKRESLEALREFLDEKAKAREERSKELQQLIGVLKREAEALERGQKELVEAGLHQPSEDGQKRYAAKLLSQSKRKLAAAG